MRLRARELLDSDITIPPIDSNKTSGVSYRGDAGFDSDMVVILASLLCALICALGLSACVRCARRFTGRSSAHVAAEHLQPAALRSESTTTGVKKEELGLIPVVVYETGKRLPATDQCPICLGEFEEGERVRILPKCDHGFHLKCIDRWLVLHSSCPTCRRPLVGGSPAVTGGSVYNKPMLWI